MVLVPTTSSAQSCCLLVLPVFAFAKLHAAGPMSWSRYRTKILELVSCTCDSLIVARQFPVLWTARRWCFGDTAHGFLSDRFLQFNYYRSLDYASQIQTQVTVMRTAMAVAKQLGVKRMVQIACGMARWEDLPYLKHQLSPKSW